MVTGLALATFSPVVTVNSTSGYSVLGNTKISADVNSDVSNNLTNQDQQNIQDINDESSTIDVATMNSEDKASFEKLIQNSVEQMDLPSDADAKDAETQLLGFFDSNSENYQNIQKTTENLSNDIDENHASMLDNVTGEKVLAANHGTVSVAVLGSALNVAIGVALGGIGQAIKSKGKAWVKKVLMSRLKSTLAGMGLGALGTMLSAGLDFALDYSNPGTMLAKYFDSHDKIRNNGYIEWW
ncbi:hypothetical protein [Leuconostoc mesenteroides]|uniref:hypothetical protein n=1 Tax=Leuconostoc mesenteroides TaxID=1245 RepID=UPI002360282E|nr:hypothetical protein [Leuconostoc mesenteroides]